jgi:hypothetical protein
MSLPFADLRLISSASDCAQHGGWSYFNSSCDPWTRPFNYPSLWVKIFSALGIVESQTQIIGRVQILLLTLSMFSWLIFLLRLTNSKYIRTTLLVIFFAFSISPPILLLLERGNIDIWIFFGLSVATMLFFRGNYFVPVALLSLLGALKIYPFASFVIILNSKFSKWKFIFLLLLFGLASISLLGEWQFVLNRSISTWNSISYGSSMIPLISFQVIGFEGSKTLAIILGWMIFSLVVFLIKFVLVTQVNNFQEMLSLNSKILVLVQGFGSAFLFTYLVGTSYDLRLILLLPVFLSFALSTRKYRGIICLITSVFVIMFGGQFTSEFGKIGLFLNILSDFVLTIFSSFLFLLIWQSIRRRIGFFGLLKRSR